MLLVMMRTLRTVGERWRKNLLDERPELLPLDFLYPPCHRFMASWSTKTRITYQVALRSVFVVWIWE